MSTVFSMENILFMLSGLKVTVLVAMVTMALSTFFGSILAVLRNYGGPVFSRAAAVYIEIFRNTPNILWILAIRFMVPIPPMASGILSFTLFTTAVVAEIIRGGLNSVPKGQFEGAASQGFTFVQTLWYIIMPQCFRKIVPSLLSQIITVVKDTSFLWVVSIEEFTGKGMIIMGKLTTSAQVLTLFASIAAVYFVLNFALSCVVRARQKKAV